MAKLPKIPVDVKSVFDAGNEAASEQDKPVRVAVLVDTTAAPVLIALVKELFTPLSSKAFLHIEPLGDEVPKVDGAADLIVTVAGNSSVVGPAHARFTAQGLASVIVCDNMQDVTARATAAGSPIPLPDMVPYNAVLPQGQEPSSDFSAALGAWIVDTCREARLPLANAFAFLRRPVATEIIKATAFQNGALGAVLIIPGADMPVMTANQIKMVLQMAGAYGLKLGKERIKELLVVVAGGFAFRTVARQLITVVPGLGWAIKAGIGYTGTTAMGYAALEYFEGGGSLDGVGAKLVEARDRASKQTTAAVERRNMRREARRRKKESLSVDPVYVGDVRPPAKPLGNGEA